MNRPALSVQIGFVFHKLSFIFSTVFWVVFFLKAHFKCIVQLCSTDEEEFQTLRQNNARQGKEEAAFDQALPCLFLAET